jgi:hypothetical protein
VAENLEGTPESLSKIEDSDEVFRWVHQNYVDSKSGTVKLKRGVFKMKQHPPEGAGISMYLKRLLPLDACKSKARSINPGFVGIVSLYCSDFREHRLDLRQDQQEEDEIGHVEVVGYELLDDAELANIERVLIQRATPTYQPI